MTHQNKENKWVTEQESFWAGDFGKTYTERNSDTQLIKNNEVLFSKALKSAQAPQSIIEFGANVGFNLSALSRLYPQAEISAIEINQFAVEKLKQLKLTGQIYPQSILDFKPDHQRDLAFTKGVLIHINPEALPKVYDLLYQTSKKYILMAEYYNPAPVEIVYRGFTGRLFKRDFAGEFLDRFSDVSLIDYGFAYRRDPQFPQDDLTWFLFQKK